MLEGNYFKSVLFKSKTQRRSAENMFIVEMIVFRINKIILDMREHFSYRVNNDLIHYSDFHSKNTMRNEERKHLEKVIYTINYILMTINQRITPSNKEKSCMIDYLNSIDGNSEDNYFMVDLKILLDYSKTYRKFLLQILEQFKNLKRLE